MINDEGIEEDGSEHFFLKMSFILTKLSSTLQFDFYGVIKINVVKTGQAGEPEKASSHGSTRSNRLNRWLDRITVD